jgi:hypothetical protein
MKKLISALVLSLFVLASAPLRADDPAIDNGNSSASQPGQGGKAAEGHRGQHPKKRGKRAHKAHKSRKARRSHKGKKSAPKADDGGASDPAAGSK